jgi:hypothetical protein
MPRFVILEHTGTATYKPGTHWDLMLEAEGRLRTWELQQLPTDGVPVTAKSLPDHRLDYLEFEGDLTADRGSLIRWDSGECDAVSETNQEVVVQLNGGKLCGCLRLTRTAADTGLWQADFS